jgi:hypothetical protein
MTPAPTDAFDVDVANEQLLGMRVMRSVASLRFRSLRRWEGSWNRTEVAIARAG